MRVVDPKARILRAGVTYNLLPALVSQLRNIPIEKIIFQDDAGYEATVITKPGRTSVDDLVNSIPC